eukprot:2715180-Alexandrium_andersonii.AAC.1
MLPGAKATLPPVGGPGGPSLRRHSPSKDSAPWLPPGGPREASRPRRRRAGRGAAWGCGGGKGPSS